MDRFRSLDSDRFDAVVIGAGGGGLTAAALLARRGRRVLVVDGQYVVGGNAMVFRRKDYRFDVGVHYIGGCHPDGAIPRILAAAGAGQVEFEELDPDGYDTVLFPDFTFRFPKGIDAYEARLLEAFPREAKGIRRYVRLIRDLHAYQGLQRHPWKAPLVIPRLRLLAKWAQRPFADFLDTCTDDPRLRALVAAQNGTYGQPPSRASTAIAVGLTHHYLEGAYFPRGSGQALSDALAESIEAHGGRILLRTRAEKILVEDGRAVGVRLDSHHLGRIEVRAPVVISNADLKKTMLELVGPEHLAASTVARTQGYEMSPGLGVLYLGVRRDLVAEGHPRTNYYVYPDYDLERGYREVRAGRLPPPAGYVALSSVKDPTNRDLAPPGHSNLQVMTVAPSQPEAWGVTAEAARTGAYRRDPHYRAMKARLADLLFEVARPVFPHLREEAVYQEVATPLSHARYTESTGGTSYGLALTAEQFPRGRAGYRTEIPGLFLAGASTRSGHGIGGVLHSGLMAADRVLGGGLASEVLGPRRSLWGRRRRAARREPAAAV